MKVTIITPTDNNVKTLKYNLDSVALQAYYDIEHIVIDNCSKDGTLELLNQYPHISRIISEKNFGIHDAINIGIASSTGDIIGILHADSYLANEFTIKTIVYKFSVKRVDALCGSLIYTKQTDPSKILRICNSGDFHPQLIYRGWALSFEAFYVKREVYNIYGTFNTSFYYTADYEMMLWLFLKQNVSLASINETIVYTFGNGSITNYLRNYFQIKAEEIRSWRSLGLKYKWYTFYLKSIRKYWQYIYHLFSIRWHEHTTPSANGSSYLYKRLNVF